MNGDLINSWLVLLNHNSRLGKVYSLPVLSGSMLPALVPGKQIRIRRTGWRKCHRGDIVVFRQGHRLTAHRLLLRVGFGTKRFVFQKGDSAQFGMWIRADEVVGLVVEAQNDDGRTVHLHTAYERKRNRTIADKQLLLDLYARFKSIPKYVKRRLYK